LEESQYLTPQTIFSYLQARTKSLTRCSTTQTSDCRVLHAKEKPQNNSKSCCAISGVHDIGALTLNDPLNTTTKKIHPQTRHTRWKYNNIHKGATSSTKPPTQLPETDGHSKCWASKNTHDPQRAHTCWSYSFNDSPECLYKNGIRHSNILKKVNSS
jgi:hypothetical protein